MHSSATMKLLKLLCVSCVFLIICIRNVILMPVGNPETVSVFSLL